MQNQNSNIYALAILAHPDDESFLLAGTTLKLAEEGKKIGIICATRGEKGADRLNRGLTEEQIGQMRTKELHDACNILGCHCTDFFNYPDGGLHQADFNKLVSDLIPAIERCQPEVIITFGAEGVTGHKDHIVMGKAATEAAGQAKHRAKEIWLASIPCSLIKSFNQHLLDRKVHHGHFHDEELKGVDDHKLLKIDISKYAAQKHEAIKAHTSQYLPHFVTDLFLSAEYFEVIKTP